MRQLYKQFTQALPGSYERKFGARAAILCGAPDNFRGVASWCSIFRGKNVRKKRDGDAKSVRCSEFRGGRFSEVANVLHKRDFQSVIATLSAVGSVSASRSVRSGRFYCNTTKSYLLFYFLSVPFLLSFVKRELLS